MGQGLHKEGITRFTAAAASHVGDDKVPGLVALVAHGDEVHVEALGTLAVGGGPVERASLFIVMAVVQACGMAGSRNCADAVIRSVACVGDGIEPARATLPPV